MSRADALVELIRGRIHSEHDGECHLTDAEAHAIADFLSEADQRVKDTRRVALEDAAAIIDVNMLCSRWDGTEVLHPRGNSGNKVGLAYASAIRALQSEER